MAKELIREIAASLNLGQYILIYAGTFLLAIIIALVGGSGSKSKREGIIALLAFFGGMQAVAYVTIALEKTNALLAVVVLCVFTTIIGLPAAGISAQTPDAPNETNDFQIKAYQSPLSDAISKDLKKRGMSFVGTTTIYAFLQAIGIVNAHQKECFCYKGKNEY